jgi:hypothetical protein
MGRILTKGLTRKSLHQELSDPDRLEKEAQNGWMMLSHPSTVKALEGVLMRLSKSKI